MEEVQLVLYRAEGEDEFQPTGKAVCTLCLTLLAATHGNHVGRHVLERCKKRKVVTDDQTGEEVPAKQRKITEYNNKKLSAIQLKKITEASSKFCLRSGKSFNFVSSEPVEKLIFDVINAITPGFTNDTIQQLPTRTTIQAYSERYARELVSKAFELVKPQMENHLNIVIDHGKLVNNYLSIYGSFLNDEFKLQIVPLGFTPALEGKSIAETVKLLTRRFEEFGIPEEQVLKCYITADGALSGLKNHFEKYVRCVNHSLNLVAERAVNPLEDDKKKFTQAELEILRNVAATMRNAEKVSNAIRTNWKMCETMSKLPALCIQTRWLIGLKCVTDVFELSDEIQSNFGLLSSIGRTAFSQFAASDFKTARTIVVFFDKILHFNKMFQTQQSVSLHLVLPLYKILEVRWKRYQTFNFKAVDNDEDDLDMDVLDTEVLTCLAKAGLIALEHYIKEFDDIHYAAVLLSPRTKEMKAFATDDILRAKRFVRSVMPTERTAPQEARPARTIDAVQTLYELVGDRRTSSEGVSDELEKFLNEKVEWNASESVEVYWLKKKDVFPALFAAAKKVFATLPSESICETSFSTAALHLDKRRARLHCQKAELVVLGAQLASKYPDWI
ncbi:hypothetical protein CAEBREN_21077 [Caenorhabditis brenneri]|uniref:HAT C-terminal dimerisation domain-containing protein n=1 Tax=Caenorhabditis brenneri TaxID=135651 RepID=G0N0C7_CAEBE|nr:hypothetical protein CAEBREN_21077 [Caenorhabditis brenneri]